MNYPSNNIYQLKRFKTGEIKPLGWIEKQLKRDLTQGYIGQFDKINSTVNKNVFVSKNRLSKNGLRIEKEWWNGEHEAYWKDSIIRMAHLTNNMFYKSKTQRWVNDIIENIDSSGYIGIYEDSDKANSRFNHKKSNGELWTISRIHMALLAYYEFTGNNKVLQSVINSMNFVWENYKNKNYFKKRTVDGGVSHGIGIFDNLEWLYRITQDKSYLKIATKFYYDYNVGKVRDGNLKLEQLIYKNKLFTNHGAHIAEGLSVPEFISAIEPSKIKNAAAQNALEKLKKHLTPGGAMRCDEWVKGRKGSADERYEYCGITELIDPLIRIISLNKKIAIGDIIETMVFNAGQGARFPDLSAVSYLTSDNRLHINNWEIGGRENYDVSHRAAPCCALNAGRLMPYYIDGMWMKDENSNGLTALLFGPCQLSTHIFDIPVEITEQTNYPFSDEINFRIKTQINVKFKFIIRIPHGCKSVTVKAPDSATINRGLYKIEIDNNWHDMQQVFVKFHFKIHYIEQPSSKSVKQKGIFLKRGPLVYSLPFDYEIKNKKEYKKSGFFRYKLKAKKKELWDMKFHSTDIFEYNGIIDPGKIDYPWDKPVVRLKGTLRNKRNEKCKYNYLCI